MECLNYPECWEGLSITRSLFLSKAKKFEQPLDSNNCNNDQGKDEDTTAVNDGIKWNKVN